MLKNLLNIDSIYKPPVSILYFYGSIILVPCDIKQPYITWLFM